jgi:hypothetical protein
LDDKAIRGTTIHLRHVHIPLLQWRTKAFFAGHLLVGRAAVLSSSPGLVQVEGVPGHKVEHQFPAGQLSKIKIRNVRRFIMVKLIEQFYVAIKS